MCALLLMVIGFLPLGDWLISPLESRFTHNPALPEQVDGIIVLGGALAPKLSATWDQPELGGGADRLTTFLALARQYPQAELVFTGGSGSLTDQEFKEAVAVEGLFNQLGLKDRGVIYESESRNTFENAVYTKELMQPGDGENWVLITSAFHMPRSIGIFCGLDWPVFPYPVDHQADKDDLWRVELGFGGHLGMLDLSIKEWVGLFAYRITGRTSQLLAGETTYCGAESS
ncbi:MAG: hypothetical protein CMQ17_13495 [Gammaproteobacteria bacterium]|nr:hypothetical protein [Gammaproteobacteria bacterium]HJO10837.1 YdcF family protein [Gammaproteobacteria bacterium]